MARRLFFTILAVILAGAAFYGADPWPDVNLFGVVFLCFAYLVWFFWSDIEAGYSFLDDAGVPRYESSNLLFIRFAPMHLRELADRKSRSR